MYKLQSLSSVMEVETKREVKMQEYMPRRVLTLKLEIIFFCIDEMAEHLWKDAQNNNVGSPYVIWTDYQPSSKMDFKN